MTHHRSTTRSTTRTGTVAALAASLLLAPIAGTARARPDDGPRPGSVHPRTLCSWPSCPLERVGPQFVRGDDLTGAGADAPSWVPEQAGS